MLGVACSLYFYPFYSLYFYPFYGPKFYAQKRCRPKESSCTRTGDAQWVLRSLVVLAQGTHSGHCRGRGPFLVLLFFALECRVLDVLFPLFRPGARLALVHFSNSVEPLSLFLLLSIGFDSSSYH